MAKKRKKRRGSPLVVRSKSPLSREYIDECRALQRRICEERGGGLLPDSTGILRAMRDESAGGHSKWD